MRICLRKQDQSSKQNNEYVRITGDLVRLEEDILKAAITNLKNKGPDEIPSVLIKYGLQKLVSMKRVFMERCLNAKDVPSAWKVAWINSLHKKWAKGECSNYRSLFVICSVSRLYGKILNQLVLNDYQHYQSEEQPGFRAGR